MNRTTRLLGLTLAATVALVGLAGCGRLRDHPTTDPDTDTALTWDAQALEAVGFTTADLFVADGGSTPAPQGRHPRLRFLFRHTLHGEATVQTEEGLKTVVAQRGTVTAVTDATVTVNSTDGFSLTWRLTDRTVVRVHGSKATMAEVPVGTEVGVAGARDGDNVDARLVVVPRS